MDGYPGIDEPEGIPGQKKIPHNGEVMIDWPLPAAIETGYSAYVWQ
jgi:hypothetical protein